MCNLSLAFVSFYYEGKHYSSVMCPTMVFTITDVYVIEEMWKGLVPASLRQ